MLSRLHLNSAPKGVVRMEPERREVTLSANSVCLQNAHARYRSIGERAVKSGRGSIVESLTDNRNSVVKKGKQPVASRVLDGFDNITIYLRPT